MRSGPLTRFAVDSWAPSYGLSTDDTMIDIADAAETTVTVDPTVETADWAPITPSAEPFTEIAFIDGVRRTEAHVWIAAADGTQGAGVCASIAAGTVIASAGMSTVEERKVHRGLYTGCAVGDISTISATYEFVHCPAGDNTIHNAINSKMAGLEALVGIPTGVEMIVYDGPLRARNDPRGVGYVKTLRARYLDEARHKVLFSLNAGQRTPVFLIGDDFGRWSWYLRLPGRAPHPLACLVRCEIPHRGVARRDAIARAERASVTLPRYASEPYREPRAPQNLYPIAALERDLRGCLGDAHILKGDLEAAALQSRSGAAL